LERLAPPTLLPKSIRSVSVNSPDIILEAAALSFWWFCRLWIAFCCIPSSVWLLLVVPKKKGWEQLTTVPTQFPSVGDDQI